MCVSLKMLECVSIGLVLMRLRCHLSTHLVFFFTQKVIFLAQHFYLIMYTTAIEQIPLVQTSIFSATNMTFLVYHPIAFDRQIIVSLSVTLSFSKSLKEIFMSPLQIKGNASFGGICQFLSSGYQTRNSVLF